MLVISLHQPFQRMATCTMHGSPARHSGIAVRFEAQDQK